MRLIAVLFLTLVTASASEASVLYTLVDRSCTIEALGITAACATTPPRFSFEVEDAAIVRGSFDLVGRGLPVQVSGDLADLLALDGAIAYRPASSYGFAGALAIHVRFAPDGDILSSSFYAYGTNDGALLSGTSNSFGGWFDDEGLCQHDVAGRLCTETGRLLKTTTVADEAEVREPTTTPLLAATALMLFGIWRSRQKQRAVGVP